MKTALSVNVNKIALIRNSRGANRPDLLQMALDIESYGADGITIHPRPDERHIRYSDVPLLKDAIATELNVEGYPSRAFLDMVLQVKPDQCTLVPDDPSQLTSDHGWDTLKQQTFLQEVIGELHDVGIRVSIFLDPDPELVASAKMTGTDRIELYTGPFAHDFAQDRVAAVKPYAETAATAYSAGLGVNAGHDLDLSNLGYFVTEVPHVLEVSIGHALVSDALYYGMSNVVGMYQACLRHAD